MRHTPYLTARTYEQHMAAASPAYADARHSRIMQTDCASYTHGRPRTPVMQQQLETPLAVDASTAQPHSCASSVVFTHYRCREAIGAQSTLPSQTPKRPTGRERLILGLCNPWNSQRKKEGKIYARCQACVKGTRAWLGPPDIYVPGHSRQPDTLTRTFCQAGIPLPGRVNLTA
jgi:hypothetical protein